MPAFSTLVDTFTRTSLGTLWPIIYSGPTIVNNQAQIPSDGNWPTLQSDSVYSIVSSSVFAQWTPASGVGRTSEGYSTLDITATTAPVGSRLSFSYDAPTNVMRFSSDTDWWDTNGVDIPYDPTTMKWFRVRGTTTQVFMETSPDATTWTVRRTITIPTWATGSDLSIRFQSYQDAGISYAYVDNVNSPPVTTPTAPKSVTVKVRQSSGSWKLAKLSRLFPTIPVAPSVSSIKPSNFTQAQIDTHVQTLWNNWKVHLRQDTVQGWYAVYADAQAGANPYVAEGQGYGMLAAVQMAPIDPQAKTIFDGLTKYVLDHPSSIDTRLHAAEQNAQMVSHNGADSATDGDLDIAMAHLMAHERWGSAGTYNYLQLARTRITGIKESNISSVTGLLELGDWSSGNWLNISRPSDWMIGHMEAFYRATSDPAWLTIKSAHMQSIQRLQSVYAPSTGLLPDFTINPPPTIQPAPAQTLESDNDGNYYYNACRVPWRLGAAQDNDARAAAAKISAWSKTFSAGNPSNFTAGHTLSGTALTTYTDMSFTAPLVVGASVGADQTWLNSLWTYLSQNLEGTLYYPASIQLLSMIEVTGTFKISPFNN